MFEMCRSRKEILICFLYELYLKKNIIFVLYICYFCEGIFMRMRYFFFYKLICIIELLEYVFIILIFDNVFVVLLFF